MAQSKQQTEFRGQQRGEVAKTKPHHKANMGSSTNVPATYPPPQKASQEPPSMANSTKKETSSPGTSVDNISQKPEFDDIQEI
jgi:hypothetical protein